MKKLYDRITDTFKHSGEETTTLATPSSSSPDVLEQYKIEKQKIKIENQPFRLSGLLHILTNKISEKLKYHRHQLYYDIDKEVARYIVGDNDYIEQILKPLMEQLITLNSDAEIILHISKEKERYIVFDLSNPDGELPKALCNGLNENTVSENEYTEILTIFNKAKNIAEAMQGSLAVECSRRSGTHFIFKLPYIQDEDARSNRNQLKDFLSGKRALFIGNTKYETQRAQYIFGTFGLEIVNMSFDEFDSKKPDLDRYFMVILRSADLSYKHVSFLKMLRQNPNIGFKLIIIHELFEEESKIAMTKPIADAELYSPIIIGDVEEILYQMFIRKSKAVTGISNMQVFDPSTFVVKGNKEPTRKDMEHFRGAHIAVAEDSKVDQRIIRNILDVDGIKLFMVNNGKELLDLLRKEEIDIVLTDINMPIMNGLTVTREIRSVDKWKDLPIVSISSMAFVHEIEAMKEAGMDGSITKPITAQDLYRALEQFLKITPEMQARYARNVRQRDLASYDGNPAILDVEKGIEETGNKMEYLELLNETMEVLEDGEEELRTLILEGEYMALKTFTQSMIRLYSNIHAPEMVNMFKEILMYLSTNTTMRYLSEYIHLYAKNRKHLKKEIEKLKAFFAE